jgi:hypothetical protein
MIMLGPPSRARARLHGHLWLLVPTPSSHWSGPRFGTAPLEWELAIVDLVLVARLDAKSLLGSAGRLVVAAYASASGATSGAANPTSI